MLNYGFYENVYSFDFAFLFFLMSFMIILK